MTLPSPITWDLFPAFGLLAIAVSAGAAYLSWKDKRRASLLVSLLSIAILGAFIAGLWLFLDRPPMRTQGETRLWYSFFVLLSGLLVYARWHYRWIPVFSAFLSAVFVFINIFKPQIHSKTLMPALDSPLFVPHVISYMFAYGLLGVALLMGLYFIFWRKEKFTPRHAFVMDNLVYTGLGFLMIGLLLGAIWAKQAWGTYWAWDPKETWAAITMSAYLLFLHHRRFYPKELKSSLLLLAVSFLFLQMCWYGVNYLPSAASSIHVYSS